MKFSNRTEAGKRLAEALHAFANLKDIIVLALPRGGVPVGYEIAQALHAPLDVFLVRKLGVPGHSEFAMGAIAMGDVIVLNKPIIKELNVTDEELQAVLGRERKELQRRADVYRGNHESLPIKDKTVILVDDGIATGATMSAAIKALRLLSPAKLVVAVPVAAMDTYEEMIPSVDDFICLLKPDDLQAVGLWYENFPQTEDAEVIELLEKARR